MKMTKIKDILKLENIFGIFSFKTSGRDEKSYEKKN
jgi:hypothetical protein